MGAVWGFVSGAAGYSRSAIHCLLAVLALTFTSGAFAQTGLDTGKPPPPVQTIDRNGVDLKSGQFYAASAPIGIGPADDPALSYAAFDINWGGGGGTPLTGWVMYHGCGLSDLDCYANYMVVRMGGKTVQFQDDGSSSLLYAPTGEVLNVDTYTVYDTNDTEWHFSGARGYAGNESQTYQSGALVKVVYRDGHTLSYSGGIITSNLGYTLVGNGVNGRKLVNLAVDYCSATACENTQPWPTFSLTNSGPFNDRTTTFTDPLNRSTTVRSVLTGSPQITTVTLTRPGGLVSTIVRKGIIIFTDPLTGGKTFNGVSSYSDNYFSTAYSYQGNSQLSLIGTQAVSSDGTTISRSSPNNLASETVTNEIGRTSTSYFSTYSMPSWSDTPTPGLLIENRTQEDTRLAIGYYLGAVASLTATPKPLSNLDPIGASANYPHCEGTNPNRKLCHQPDYTLDARGARTDYTYYPSGMLWTMTAPPDANDVRQETRYVWEQKYAVFKHAAGAAPTPSAFGAVWKLTSTSTCRTLAGAACVNTADEVRTTIEYDGNLRPISVTERDGTGTLIRSTTREYDPIGNVRWTDGPLPGTVDRTYFFWDAARQLEGEIGPDPDGDNGIMLRPAKRYHYTPHGLVDSAKVGTATGIDRAALNAMVPSVETITAYDLAGRKTSERAKGDDGVVYALTEYKYDGSGRLECTAVRMNRAVYNAITVNACTPFTPGAAGTPDDYGPDRITQYSYDAAGQLLQVREGVGTAVAAAEVTYTYTPNGKIKFVIDGAGNRAELRYDGFDRQNRWVFPASQCRPGTCNTPVFNGSSWESAINSAGQLNEADFEQYGYDANGNRTSLRKRDDSLLTYQYDKLNRMTAKLVPERASYWCGLPTSLPGTICNTHTRDVHYGYDLRGLMTSARFDSASGEGVELTYDAFGRKTSETLTMDGVPRAIGSAYDANDRRNQLTYPGGTYVYYHGHQTGHLSYATLGNSDTLFQPSYDSSGRVHRLDRPAAGAPNTLFGYDPLSRLGSLSVFFSTSAYNSTSTFTRNPASQIIRLTQTNSAFAWTGAAAMDHDYVPNGLNQYGDIEGVAHTYDLNGNLTGDGTHTYIYDVENRLISRIRAGGTSAWLRYDPLGRLYEVYGTDTGYTRFLYDGDALVAEYGGTQSSTTMPLLRRYAHGPAAGVDDPLVWFEGSGTDPAARRHLYADERGSIVAITNGVGNVLQVNAYDEYGLTGTTIGGDIATRGRFRYTGQTYIPEIGMYYYKARFYSPTLGRFMQTDPIGYDDQFNLYGYVGNDPVNRVDPSGLQMTDMTMNQRQLAEATCNNAECREEVGRGFRNAGLVGLAGVATYVTRGLILPVLARFAPSTSRAFRVANSGGRHSGYLKNIAQSSVRSLERAVRNSSARAREHREYARDNAKAERYVDGKTGEGTWGRMTNEQKDQTRDFWRKEAENYEDQAAIARDVLRAKRGS